MDKHRKITFTNGFGDTEIILKEITENDKLVLEQLKAMDQYTEVVDAHWKIHKDASEKFFTNDEINLLLHMYVFKEKVEGYDATGKKTFLINESAALNDIIQSALMENNEKLLQISVSIFRKCFPYIKIEI